MGRTKRLRPLLCPRGPKFSSWVPQTHEYCRNMEKYTRIGLFFYIYSPNIRTFEKTRSHDPFSLVKEKLKLDQKSVKREQWIGAMNLGAGAPLPLCGLVSSAAQMTLKVMGQMTLKVHDSMKLSWILRLVGTLYKRLVKVLLLSKKDYSTIKCYKGKDS